jgi:hypothetical protein
VSRARGNDAGYRPIGPPVGPPVGAPIRRDPRTGFEAPSRARYGVDPCPRLSGPVGVDAVGGAPSAGEARCAAVAAARGGPGQRVMFPGHGPYLPERCRRLASDVGVSSGLDGEVALAGLLLAGWAPDRGWSRS